MQLELLFFFFFFFLMSMQLELLVLTGAFLVHCFEACSVKCSTTLGLIVNIFQCLSSLNQKIKMQEQAHKNCKLEIVQEDIQY
jgi:hypothetical protein